MHQLRKLVRNVIKEALAGGMDPHMSGGRVEDEMTAQKTNSKKIRVSCRQGSHNSKYYANVWCGNEQLGHGEADTRAEAIALAKADWKNNEKI